jgi:hypothetical protein
MAIRDQVPAISQVVSSRFRALPPASILSRRALPGLAPQAMRATEAHRMAIATKENRDPAIAVTGILPRQHRHLFQRRLMFMWV